MREKTVLIIVVELVMAVFGLLLAGEWAKPLPEPPSHEMAVWLPTGSIDPGLVAEWGAQQVTSQKSPALYLDEFKMKYFSSRFYMLSGGSMTNRYGGSGGTYLTYFGRDTQGKIWTAEELVSGWSPALELPPRPYRPENYHLDPVRGVVVVTTGYDQATAVIGILVGVGVGLLLFPSLKYVLVILGALLYTFTGIRFRSPIVRG